MKIRAEEVIPQRKPFIFIDELFFCDREVSETRFTIPGESLFTSDGGFETAGIIENMAQTAVARIGYLARFVNNAPVTVGYIGNVHNLKVYRRPKVGETLHTSVTLKNEIAGIALSEAVVRIGDETIAEATLKTSQAE